MGALTVSLVGSFDTMELAVATWDAQSVTTAATDDVLLFIEPGVGPGRYHLVKKEIA